MPRSLRLDPHHGIHHVYSRGTKRWALFLDDLDRRRFLGAIDRVCRRYEVEVLAYCLMDNHFHLVLRCPEGGLSATLRDLKSLYARGFNDRHHFSGPIYEGRFGSKLVVSHRQLRQLVRYVHRNPYAIHANLDLASYRWCSHANYLGLRPRPDWLCIEPAHALFGSYKDDVERPVSSDEVQNQAATLVRLVDAGGDDVLTSPSLTEILVAVARSAGCEVALINPRRRNGFTGLVVLLGSEAGYSYREMCDPLGYRTRSAVESAAHRARQRIDRDAEFASLIDQARSRLWPAAA